MTTTETAVEAAKSASDNLFVVDPSIRRRRRENLVVAGSRVVIIILTLGLWELCSGRIIDKFWISSPSAIAAAVQKFWDDGLLWPAIVATLSETALGFGLGAITGILVGLVFGVSPLIARILDPFLVGVNSIPRVALIPLFILWFGIGFETKVLFAAALVFFPVFINTFAGARDVDRDLIDVIRVMGASHREAVRKVLVPSALVWVFAGLKMSIPFALIGAVIAEMFAGDDGLGYLISVSANQYDTAGSFGAIFVTTLLGLGLTYLVSLIEAKTLRWRHVDH
ncbi:ABC transporter permease [Nocardia sp. NPDC051787]|uniref:ABC transporter permease n=1 Tax=Nocardia sp. NPDC051787 TaxID=3155415 RepID=UPI00341C6829